MTLLTANSASAIVVSALLAMCCLNEVFILKYDLPALILLVTGSVTIVLQSDTTEKSYDSEQIHSLFTDKSGMAFLVSVCVFHLITFVNVRW